MLKAEKSIQLYLLAQDYIGQFLEEGVSQFGALGKSGIPKFHWTYMDDFWCRK